MKSTSTTILSISILTLLVSCGGGGQSGPNRPGSIIVIPGPVNPSSEECSDKTHTLKFSWSKNPDPVSGYQIYKGTNSRNYTTSFDVGLTQTPNAPLHSITAEFQFETPYYFAATAYTNVEESGYSDEVEVTFHCIDGEVVTTSTHSVVNP